MFSSLTLLELKSQCSGMRLVIARNKQDIDTTVYVAARIHTSICSQCRQHAPYTVDTKPLDHAGALAGAVTIRFMMRNTSESGMYFCSSMQPRLFARHHGYRHGSL